MHGPYRINYIQTKSRAVRHYQNGKYKWILTQRLFKRNKGLVTIYNDILSGFKAHDCHVRAEIGLARAVSRAAEYGKDKWNIFNYLSLVFL